MRAQWHTWDAPWPEFPFHSTRLNTLVLHDHVVDLAEALARHLRHRLLHGHRDREVRPPGLGLQPAAPRRLPEPHAGRAPARARLPAGGVLRLSHRRDRRRTAPPASSPGRRPRTSPSSGTRSTTWTTPISTQTRRTRRRRPDPSWPTAPTCTTDQPTTPTRRGTASCCTSRSATATPAGAATRPGRSGASRPSSPSTSSRRRRASSQLLGVPAPGHPYWNEATLAGVQAATPASTCRPGATRWAEAALSSAAVRRARPAARASRVSATKRQVEQQLLAMMARQDLEPDRQTVDEPAGMLIAGLPLRFDGRRQRRVVHDGPDEADLVDEVPARERGGRRALRREGHVRVGRAEHEIRLVEQVGHGAVELAAVALDRCGSLEVVALPGALESGGDLGRQLVDAVRVGSPRSATSGGWFAMAHAPRSGGSVGDTSTSTQPGRSSQTLGRGRRRVRRPRHGPGRCPRSTTIAAVRPDRSCVAEAGLPPLHPRQAQRITAIEPVADVEVTGGVAHRTGQAAQDGGHRLDGAVGALGDPPVGRLQPEQAAEPCRPSDGPAAVAPGGDRQKATGHRGRRSARRAARRAAPGSTGCASSRAARSRCS